MGDLVLALIKTAFSKRADTDNGRALQWFARGVLVMASLPVLFIGILAAWIFLR